MADMETDYGEPDFEAFALRGLADVSTQDDHVTVAFKTYVHPSPLQCPKTKHASWAEN